MSLDSIVQTSADDLSFIDERYGYADPTGGLHRSIPIASSRSAPFKSRNLSADNIVEDLSARIKQLERLVAVQNRSLSSAEHQALVVTYKALLRVEAEKRLDLVAMISSFKNELASCQMEQPQKTVSYSK